MSQRTPHLAWGHININVLDLERSIAFYEKLGFEMFIPAIPYLGLSADAAADDRTMPDACAAALGISPEIRGRACIMQLGRGFPKIDLTEFEGGARAHPPTNEDLGVVRLCLASQDLQADYVYLSDCGVDFVSTPTACKDGLAEIALCRDPDGTLIELLQVHLEKWPSLPSS